LQVLVTVERRGDCCIIEEVDDILDTDKPAPPTAGNPPAAANAAAAPAPALTTNTAAAPAATTAAEPPAIIMNKRVGNMLVARLNGLDHAFAQLKEDVFHKMENQACFTDLKQTNNSIISTVMTGFVPENT